MKHYILTKNNKVQLCSDRKKWAKWFYTADRSVARTHLPDCYVSTVFLGFDHRMSGKGTPVLWESMTFGGPYDGEQTRCSGGRAQAKAMHTRMVKRINTAQSIF